MLRQFRAGSIAMLLVLCLASLAAVGCDHREKHVTVIEQRPARAVVVERRGPVIVEHRHAPPPVIVERRPVVVQRRPAPVVVERRPVVVERRSPQPQPGRTSNRASRSPGRDQDREQNHPRKH